MWGVCWRLVVAVAYLAVATYAQDGGDAGEDVCEDLVVKAETLVNEGKLQQAAHALETAVDMEPRNSKVLSLLGKVELQMSNDDGALASSGIKHLMNAMNAKAEPPISIDSEEGYNLATMIGWYLTASQFRYHDGAKWFKLAAKSTAPHNDCFDVFGTMSMPYLATETEEKDLIQKYHSGMHALLQKPELNVDKTACFAGVFNLAYFDIDYRLAYGQYVHALFKAFPTLLVQAPNLAPSPPDLSNRRLKVGFFSSFFSSESSIWGSFGKTIVGLPRDEIDVYFIHYGSTSIGPRGVKIDPPQNNLYLDTLGTHLQNINENRIKIANLQLDVLVYLDMYMSSEIHQLALARLAPVQATTHGHPVTSGIPRSIMNYYISWESAELPTAQEHYTEELVLIKGEEPWEVYVPRNDWDKQVTIVGYNISWGHVTRDTIDFWPEEYIGKALVTETETRTWYLCVQASFKFHHTFDKMLAKIHERDARAVLILVESTLTNKPHHPLIVKRLKKSGVDMKRVVWIPRMLHWKLMALYNLADVVLDSFQFGGDTTTREALETGAPIVTLPHRALGQRWTQAYYKALGITDLIASTPDEYVSLAVDMANDKTKQKEMRARIKANLHKLFHNTNASRKWADLLLDIARRGPQEQVHFQMEDD